MEACLTVITRLGQFSINLCRKVHDNLPLFSIQPEMQGENPPKFQMDAITNTNRRRHNEEEKLILLRGFFSHKNFVLGFADIHIHLKNPVLVATCLLLCFVKKDKATMSGNLLIEPGAPI